MGVVIVCGASVVAAFVGAVRWRNRDVEAPDPGPEPSRRELARQYVWWVQLIVLTGLVTGVLVVGAGGRLAMRLLGATGGDRAQGRLTEANEVVGEITVAGTIGFIIFVGLLTGLVTALLWFALRRYLPARWVGGMAFGAGLLVLLGTRNEPLRPGNRDFDLVGPWWLAVLVFTALALGHGVALSAFAARLSRWLPLPGRNLRSLSYLVLLLLVPIFPLGIAVLVGGILHVFARPSLDAARRWSVSTGPLRVGQAVIAAAVLVAAPGFVTAIGDLVGRGP